MEAAAVAHDGVFCFDVPGIPSVQTGRYLGQVSDLPIKKDDELGSYHQYWPFCLSLEFKTGAISPMASNIKELFLLDISMWLP